MLIDFHSHSLLSDGVLLPSELIRRYAVAGFDAIAITDHADSSNIDNIVASLVKVCREINKYWAIRAIPGIELTHIPLEQFAPLVKYARENGAKIIVAHGQTPVEPVIEGTNRAAIEAGVDILAHPGKISVEDSLLAKNNNVYLEITTRKGHCLGNCHVARVAVNTKASLVINTDFHEPRNMPSRQLFARVARSAGLSSKDIAAIDANKERLLNKALGI
ncbi:MAG: histidinol phosphate phosphatase domain-containing protein [Candidatus Omnitrophica bacterium]|nr:histidinol phosphate phosphatase domain-containing protein [Candidatus Omnitrophota bacterium]